MIGNILQLTALSAAMFLFASDASLLNWHSLVTDFGFPIALVLFFVWNSYTREQRISNRVTKLEDFIQDDLMDLNKQAIKAIADNTEALNRLVKVLETRPCLCDGPDLIAKVDTVLDRVQHLTGNSG